MTGAHPRPVPQGDYVPARRLGDMVFTSGMTPRRDGKMMFFGPVCRDRQLEEYREAVELACVNALVAARSVLAAGENIAGILSLTVYIATEPGFEAHAKLADFASGWLRAELGAQGVGTRAAIGVASLPGNAPVEIQLVAIVGS